MTEVRFLAYLYPFCTKCHVYSSLDLDSFLIINNWLHLHYLQVVIDYNDLMMIPYFRDQIEENTKKAVKLRTGSSGEVANQICTRQEFYQNCQVVFITCSGSQLRQKVCLSNEYLSKSPFCGEGRKQELREKEKAHELYLHVKSEVESCLAYLKEKRESDPYRNILPRLFYQATHGFTSDVPTFEL
ncbi:Acyltransferase-like protein, chloroplastic [Vitis vinifera]|uniref:Acyltransferase-like protein, chloroplastic n=1 Tax=Vitis vinifera TaxID=29760 RepID=A0A438ECG1_VITVI|nr:Acyltransferase-like protein, chloroplastic [Vitis vinifera]